MNKQDGTLWECQMERGGKVEAGGAETRNEEHARDVDEPSGVGTTVPVPLFPAMKHKTMEIN